MEVLQMPHIGFGTYPLKGSLLTNTVITALECGFRMFDTAHNYGNEEDLGNALKIAIKKTSIKREEIFINTKIDEEWKNGGRDCKFNGSYFYKTDRNENKDVFSIVKKQIETSLKRLQTDYLDCVLIHWPYPDYLLEIWESLEVLHKQGVIKHIGVANCRERHLKKIIENCQIKPMVNQVQISPVNTMQSLVDFCKRNDIAIQVYSPIMLLRNKLKNDRTLCELAKKHNVTPSQIVLKWNLQNGYIPMPKSSNSERIKQNITLDFEIELSDMQKINSLNEDYQYLPESIYCPGY